VAKKGLNLYPTLITVIYQTLMKGAAPFFLILLCLYLFFGIALMAIAFFNKQRETHYLSLSFILRALLYLAPSIYIYNIGIEWSVWITGPIKVFIIPLNFLFIKTLFEEDKSWKRNDIWHFVPFFLDTIFTFVIAYSHANDVVNNNQIDIKEALSTVWEGNFYYTLLSFVARVVSMGQWIIYSLLTIPLIRSVIHTQKLVLSQINFNYINWLKGITYLFIVMGLFEGMAIFGIYNHPLASLSMFLVLIIYAFYFFLFVVLYYTESDKFMFENNPAAIESGVKEEEENCECLKRFIEQGIFLNPDLNLQKAATQLGIPKYKLTQFVHEEGHASFYSFVNFYRVEKSKALLLTIPDCQVIESVFRDSGFNSRSTFFRVFKEFTGETPGHYLHNNKA